MQRAQHNSSLKAPPALVRAKSKASCYQVRNWEDRFGGTLSSSDLASTLVDYANTSSTSSTADLKDHSLQTDAGIVNNANLQPQNVTRDRARPVGIQQRLHIFIVRSMLFLAGYLASGSAASFGMQLIQGDTVKTISRPRWFACCIGSLQLALLQSTVLPAILLARLRTRRLILASVGVAAGGLLIFVPHFTSNAGSILCQGLCLGFLLGLFYNSIIRQALLNNYDHTSATLASLGGPIGGATLSLARLKNDQRTHRAMGLALVVLAMVCPIILRRMPPAPSVRPMSRRTPIGKQRSLAIIAFGLVNLSLYVVPLLLPLIASSMHHFNTTDSSYLLLVFWSLHTCTRLAAAQAKMRLRSPKSWFTLSCFLHVIAYVIWYFARSQGHLFAVALLAGTASGCTDGSRTSAIVEILGFGMAEQYRRLLIMLLAAPSFIGPPVAAALLRKLGSTHGPALFGFCCFAVAGFVIRHAERAPLSTTRLHIRGIPLVEIRASKGSRSQHSNEAGPSYRR